MDKVIIFGAGTFFCNNRDILKRDENIEIVAFIDNNESLWDKRIDGITVYPPQEGIRISHDYILIMAARVQEMTDQLLTLGVKAERILFFEKYMAMKNSGKIEMFLADNCSDPKEKVLVAVPELGYTGVPMMALHAALAIRNMGYQVFLAAFAGDDAYIEYARGLEISVLLVGDLLIPGEKTVQTLSQFSHIIVNSIGLENLVVKLAKRKRVCWWLHNAKKVYGEVFEKYGRVSENDLSNISVYAVSRVAAENFLAYFPHTTVKILSGGIIDAADMEVSAKQKDKKMIFAMIGYTGWIKAQDVFIDAIERMPEHLRKKAQFWIVGRWGNGKFEEMLDEKLAKNSVIEKKGELKGQEMSEAYDSIDVVVNCSRDETLSLVVIEGMMRRKVCIASEAAGIADYIEHGKNALICRKDDSGDLCRQMCWILEHKNDLEEICQRARNTYELNFSMTAFEDQLACILKEV